MRAKVLWLAGVGLTVALVMWSAAHGWAKERERPGDEMTPASMALVGTIVAVTPESRTVVVDVPLEQDVLRVGAWIRDGTAITRAGTTATLESLEPGTRVRIEVRRITDGNEAIGVEVLSDPAM